MNMRRYLCATVALLLLLLSADWALAKEERNFVVGQAGNAAGGKRVALVIGNGEYQYTESLPKLANPTHDAEDIARALRGFGFEVIEKKNLSLEDMSEVIADFGRKSANSDAALFYYAGHGLQVKGQNYLMPVNAKIESEAQVPFQSINVNQLLEEMDGARSRANIVMLDACRNNPISGKFRSGATRGLAAPSSSPKGTVIVYATDPGNTALDGSGRNGLFTAGLLTAFKGGDLSLHGVLARTSKVVEQGSEGKQTPYINGPMTLQDEFHFGDGTQIASLVPVPAPVGGGVSLDDIKKQQEARAQWDKWQAGMKADFDKVATLNAEPGLQATAWDRFLSGYAQDNPYSAEDKQLRAQAQNRKQAAQAQQQQSAARLEQQKQEAERQRQQAQAGGSGPAMVAIPGKNYELGKYDVTRGEFAKFVSETGYDAGNSCYVWDGSKWDNRNGSNWRNPGFTQDDNHPVACVNWHDAQAYAAWLSKKTGKQYRLPNEAEWEYACYGGSQSEYCGGNNIDAVAWYKDNSGGQTHPVGQKQANGYGLYDMSGNVWQWMENKYDDKNDWRALRGGSWYATPQGARAAGRGNYDPAKRHSHGGFRLARTLP